MYFTEADSNHAESLHSRVDLSAMSALESFVRSIGLIWLARDDGNAAFEVLLSKSLDCSDCCAAPKVEQESALESWLRELSSDLPANDQNLLLSLYGAFDIWLPSARFYCALFSFDIYSSSLLDNVELSERVQSRGVLDVARSDIETRYLEGSIVDIGKGFKISYLRAMRK